jgi:hypothetical protein
MRAVNNPRHPKRGTYQPKPETLALLRVSGNPINGLGETEERRPSPFFWHPPTVHPYGDLQMVARLSSRNCPGSEEAFGAACNYPVLEPVAEVRKQASPKEWSKAVQEFAVTHEADAAGITAMNPFIFLRGTQSRNPGSSSSPGRTTMSASRSSPPIKLMAKVSAMSATSMPAAHAPIITSLTGFAPRATMLIPILAQCRRSRTYSSSHRCRPRRTGQTWLLDQPPLRIGCPSGRHHNRHAVGSDFPGRSMWDYPSSL